jgi:hypothetical protein
MAYMRGEYYLWDDESGLHIWAADGYDGWDEASWACEKTGPGEQDYARRADRTHASGVSIPQRVADEYVVMRFVEMLIEGAVPDAIDRAVRKYGRRSLVENAERLRAALKNLELDPADHIARWSGGYPDEVAPEGG